MAINDVGALQYYFNGKIFDLVGLVTNKQAMAFRNGIPTVFEKLERVRPEYFMVHVGWFNYDPYTIYTRPRMKEFSIPKEPPYYVIGAPEIAVKTDMSLFNSGDNMQYDWTENNVFTLKGKLDIADLDDEEKAGYRIKTRHKGEYPGTRMKEENYGPAGARVLDAGRNTNGSESFIVKGLNPGADLKIVKRVHKGPSCVMEVFAGKEPAGEWVIKDKGGFSEEEFLVPGVLIKSGEIEIIVKAKTNRRFNSYYYWFLQRR